MKLNPLGEVKYRIKLAEKYLQMAEKSYASRDYRDVVMNSQLSTENSAKAVIGYYRIPSWSHNPAPELRDIKKMIPDELRMDVELLARMAEELAPEHGRATYGDPTLRLTPWELYEEKDAYKAIRYARKAVKTAKKILAKLGVAME